MDNEYLRFLEPRKGISKSVDCDDIECVIEDTSKCFKDLLNEICDMPIDEA